MMKSEIYKPDTFLYFAYSANMLKFRMNMFSPTAEFVSIARLDNYRIDFIRYTPFWGGPSATMVPTANAHIWGVIWRLHNDDMVSLDHQKHIDAEKYFVKYVEVLTPYMGTFTCRAYMQKVYPLPRGNRDPIPVERWPSRSYKKLAIMGAKENGLPQYYIRFWKKLKDNGDGGCFRMACLLLRYEKNQPCECVVPGKIPRKPLKLEMKKKRGEKEGPKVPIKQAPQKKPKKGIQF